MRATLPEAHSLIALLLVAAPALWLTSIMLPRPSMLSLTATGMALDHRWGRFQLPWSAIARIDTVRLGISNGYQELPYVGIQLRQPELLLDNLSLRLASRWLIEQRDLLRYAEQEGATDARLDWEEDQVQLASGQYYDGVIAMFAQRMARLRQHLGFDLYLPAAEFGLDCDTLRLALIKARNQQGGPAPQSDVKERP
ncbi:MAG: DUF2982 domain-containing protein [Gammaproteobacteria bacterium]|nr:DUF2982 domain-containing protein [Gammaproteobacteria bacterium]